MLDYNREHWVHLDEKDYPKEARENIQIADQAINEGNLYYAAQVALYVVERCPRALEARRLLREAQEMGMGVSRPMTLGRFFLRGKAVPWFLCAIFFKVLKEPKKVLAYVERGLMWWPDSKQGQKLIAWGAAALRDFETELFAYERMAAYYPKSSKCQLILGKRYQKAERWEKLVTLAEKILETNKGQKDAEQWLRQGTTRQTKLMRKDSPRTQAVGARGDRLPKSKARKEDKVCLQ